MARFLHHRISFARRSTPYLILASVWMIGLSSGIWAYVSSGTALVSLMRSTLQGAVSIVRVLCMTSLPFLFSAFAVFLSCPWLIFPVALVKGFSFSFAAMGLMHAFGSAGWLIRLLSCFADVVTIPLLYWFWCSCFRLEDRLLGHRCVLAASLLLLAGSIDSCLIAPFLAGLTIL